MEHITPIQVAFIPIGAAAHALGIHPTTARRLEAKGEFPVATKRIGKRIMVNRAALDRYIDEPG